MDYKELMTKLKKGEALTQEEVTDLERETRPTSRFNEVSDAKRALESKLKEAEDKAAALAVDASNAQQKVQDEVTAQLRELSGKVEALTSENGELKSSKIQSENLLKVNNLARSNELGVVFKNPDYLAFRIGKDGIDLSNNEQVKAFLTSIKENEPEMCMVQVASGSGSGSGEPAGGNPTMSKPVKDWNIEEKIAYIKENGADAFQQLLTKE